MGFTTDLWVDQDLSERDVRECRRDADRFAEWGSWTFYGDTAGLRIARFGAGGFELGWRYATLGAFLISWSEIAHVARELGCVTGPRLEVSR
jgi:hypothetical protein